MLGIGGFIAIGHDRLPPRAVSVRTLASRRIGTGVGIIGLGHTTAPIGTVGRSTTRVGPGIRIVGSAGGGPSVRAVNPAGDSVGAAICIVVGTHAVGAWVGTIDGISANRIAIVRGIVIAGAAGQDRANR